MTAITDLLLLMLLAGFLTLVIGLLLLIYGVGVGLLLYLLAGILYFAGRRVYKGFINKTNIKLEGDKVHDNYK